MVKLRKSLSAGHGINAWLQQRLTAIVMLISMFVFFVFMVLASDVIGSEFITWRQFFNFVFVKIIAQLTVLAVVIHAWVGMRDVVLDYIKCYSARVSLYTVIVLWLVGSLIYSAYVIWA